jgi:hypothetical protein
MMNAAVFKMLDELGVPPREYSIWWFWGKNKCMKNVLLPLLSTLLILIPSDKKKE